MPAALHSTASVFETQHMSQKACKARELHHIAKPRLTSKGVQEGCSAVHLFLACRCIILQQLLLCHRCVKLRLHLIQASLDDRHALLSSILLLGGDLQGSGGLVVAYRTAANVCNCSCIKHV
jgi:hypothetical protein